MKTFGKHLSAPLDYRFLDLFVVIVLSLGGFVVVAIAMGIGGSLSSPLEVASRLLPDAALSRPFLYELLARGGHPPYQWGAEGLPPGIRLDAHGLLVGAAQKHGVYDVSVTVVDARRTTARRQYRLRVTDQGRLAPVVLRTTKLPIARVNGPFEVAVAAEGGVLPYRWTATGLPPGTGMNDGVIIGSPSESGVYSVHIEVSDAANQVVARDYDWQVLAADLGGPLGARQPLQISTILPLAISGTPYSIQLAAFGGRPPYQWQLNSRFPGTTLSLDGVLVAAEPGKWPDGSALSIRVFDAGGDSTTATLTPQVVRDNQLFKRILSTLAAFGSWVIVLLLLRRAFHPALNESSDVWRQPSAYLCVALLFVGGLAAFDGRTGTLLFSFLVTGIAGYILFKERSYSE